MRLVGINGPLTGATFILASGLTINGTDAASALPCGIRVAASDHAFTLEPQDGSGAVFINGLPLTRRPLQPGDEVRLGDSLLIARNDEPNVPALLERCAVAAGRLERVRCLLEVGFEEAVLHAEYRAEPDRGGGLVQLTRVVGALTSVPGLASVDAALAGFVLDVVPAARVAFADAGAPAPSIRSAWSRASGARGELTVDVETLRRACDQRVALIIEASGRQAAVAPMMAFGRAVGATWAEVESQRTTLTEEHLRLLLAVTALAAVAREHSREATLLRETREILQAEVNLAHDIVGASQPMRSLFERIARVSQSDATVLIRGETGTGKELVARAVHRNSRRASGTFVAINCAALTETLLESELFGHEKGAFTSAVALKKGKIELADGGTLFLDEIGELPMPLQAKLLRALQEREFERVGGTRPIRVDFRLIAATNRDLETAVRSGTFRQDLFYRLNVVTLTVPPLRERKQDLAVLADHFMRKHAARCGRRTCAIGSEVVSLFLKYDWPGNVRELENVIEQALVLGSGDRLETDDLPHTLVAADAAGQGSLDYHATLERTKEELILRAFEQAERNHSEAARLLGVHPNYLHRLLRNLNLRPRIGAAGSTKS